MTDKGRRIDSWKAIARYLGRDVRSVQRWEHERGLPVYRMPGEKGAVFAYEGELERWRHSRVDQGETLAQGPFAPETLPPKTATSRIGWLLSVGVAISGVLVAIPLLLWPIRPSTPQAPKVSPPRILAVLPMQNLSGGAAQDYFVDGFTDELTTALTQIRSLRVISRTSTLPYRDSRKSLPRIAHELGAKYILEGSVTREGDRVRVRAQLIDAASDTHISARDYNSDAKDILDIQSQIARAIASDINLDLSPGEIARLAAPKMVAPEAQDLYLRASYAFSRQTRDSILQSLALYKSAAAKAPSFALAYVGIAQAEASLGQITARSQEETARLERVALLTALKIDPGLGEARGLLATITYIFDRDWPKAEGQFRQALANGAQAPTQGRYGAYLITRGRFAEGMAHVQTALTLDPLGMSPRVNLFFGLYFQHRYADAQRQLEEALGVNPDFLAGHALLGLDSMMEHDCARTAVEAQWVQKHFPSAVGKFETVLYDICRGNTRAARIALGEMSSLKDASYVSPYQLALGYAAIGDKNSALYWIDHSIKAHEAQALYLRVEPLFEPLRSDQRFIAQEKLLGLLAS